MKFLSDDPAFGFTVEEIGYVSFPGTDCTSLKEILRVTEKIGVPKQQSVMEKWRENLRELVSQILSFKPVSWENCDSVLSLRDFSSLALRNYAQTKGKSSITGFQNVLENAGFAWPAGTSGFSYTKSGLVRFLDFGDDSGAKWNCALDYIESVFAWMVQSDKADGPGFGMLIRVFGKHEPYSVKKLLEGKHRSIQMPDLAVSIVEHYYSSWVEIGGSGLGFILRTLDDLMKLWPVDKDVNWMLGGDIYKTISMSKMFAENTRLFSLDVSAWDRSMDITVIEQLYLGLVRNSSVARALAFGINGRGIYKVGDLLFRFRDLRCTLWASGNNKTLSGNCIMHASLLRALGLTGFVQGDDGVCAFIDSTREDKEITSAYLSAGLTTKYVQPEKDKFEFTKRRYDLNARTVQVSADLFHKLLAETDENADRSASGVSQTLKSFQSEAVAAGWSLVVDETDPVVAQLLLRKIIVLPSKS